MIFDFLKKKATPPVIEKIIEKEVPISRNTNIFDKPEQNIFSEYTQQLNEQLNRIKESFVIKDEQIAMDSGCSSYNYNYNYDTSLSLLNGTSFMGFAQLSLFMQVPIIYNACRTFADEMLRAGYEIISCDPDNDNEELINFINDEFKRFEVDKLLRSTLFTALGLGGAYIYPKLKGDDRKLQGSTQEINLPLNVSEATINQGDVLYFQMVEPTWCIPTFVNYNNPLLPDFYVPTQYSVMGYFINATRLIKVVYNPLPMLVRPMYYFTGLSLTQKILKAVTQFNDVRDIVEKIINRYNLSVFGVPLTEFNGNNAALLQRVKDFNASRDNFGTFVIDKENEEFQQMQMTLTGLDDLMSRYAEFMCIETQIPATKLLGISPRGFTSNDETAHRNWYDLVGGLQETMLKPIMMTIIDYILLNGGYPKNNKQIDIKFNNLMESNKLEDAQIREINSRVDLNYLDGGVVSQEKVLNTLSTDDESRYNNIDVDNELSMTAEQAQIEEIKPVKTDA